MVSPREHEASYEAPSEDEIYYLLTERSNWRRWGPDDQYGALNLITPEKRLQAAQTVTIGRSVTLSRPLGARPEDGDTTSKVKCEVISVELGGGEAAAADYFGMFYHGFEATHIDALSHMSRHGKFWNDRSVDDVVTSRGVRWGDVDQWRDGIVTRGVLADVPAFRGTRYVTPEDPVHGAELGAILASQGTALQPGDALLVHSGRNSWDEENEPWESVGPNWETPQAGGVRPGLHASCMEFMRDNDVALLMWDMLDLSPSGYSRTRASIHNVIAAFGIALVDNADFGALLPLCRDLQRWEFMLVVSPLRVLGGTGSLVNPIAIL
jgi:kynurenine formamidase